MDFIIDSKEKLVVEVLNNKNSLHILHEFAERLENLIKKEEK